MTSRKQNIPSNDGALDIDAILERQIKSEKSRQEYQQRPEVQAKRKDYQQTQYEHRKLAKAAIKGDTKALTEEFGLSQEEAERAVARAKELTAVAS